jgi:hypothetical protein
VKCVQEHKATDNCCGEREKTGFVSLKDFNENVLMQDYGFLMETKKLVENRRVADPDLHKKTAPPNKKRKKQQQQQQVNVNVNQPRKLQILAKHLLDKCNTVLHLMPTSFSRRKQNRTAWKQKCIFWTMELDREHGGKELLHNNDENKSLAELLEKVEGIEEEMLFLPVYGRPANDPLFYKVEDRSMTLKELLSGKAIVEFPTILIRKQMEEKLIINSEVGEQIRRELKGALMEEAKDGGKEEEEEDQEAEEQSSSSVSSSSSSSCSSSSGDDEMEDFSGDDEIFSTKKRSKKDGDDVTNLWQ